MYIVIRFCRKEVRLFKIINNHCSYIIVIIRIIVTELYNMIVYNIYEYRIPEKHRLQLV